MTGDRKRCSRKKEKEKQRRWKERTRWISERETRRQSNKDRGWRMRKRRGERLGGEWQKRVKTDSPQVKGFNFFAKKSRDGNDSSN